MGTDLIPPIFTRILHVLMAAKKKYVSSNSHIFFKLKFGSKNLFYFFLCLSLLLKDFCVYIKDFTLDCISFVFLSYPCFFL